MKSLRYCCLLLCLLAASPPPAALAQGGRGSGGPPAVDPPNLSLAELVVYDPALGPDDGEGERFDASTPRLGLRALFDLYDASNAPTVTTARDAAEAQALADKREQSPGDPGATRKLELFIAVSDDTGSVLFKHRDAYWIGPARHAYDFPDALDLSGTYGERRLTVRVEADMKGFEPIRQELRVSYSGAERPVARIDAIELRDRRGLGRDIFIPGADFRVDATLTVTGNGAAPLRAVVRTELDCSDCAVGTPRLAAEPAAEESRELPAPLGRWQLSAGGRLPGQLPATAAGFVPLRVTVQLVSGREVVAEASRFAVIRVPKGKTGGGTLVALDPSADWQLGTGIAPLPGSAIPALPAAAPGSTAATAEAPAGGAGER